MDEKGRQLQLGYVFWGHFLYVSVGAFFFALQSMHSCQTLSKACEMSRNAAQQLYLFCFHSLCRFLQLANELALKLCFNICFESILSLFIFSLYSISLFYLLKPTR